MTLLWLQVRLRFRQMLGIDDVRNGRLQLEIERRERARLRQRRVFRLIGWCLLVASVAVIVGVAVAF